MWPGIEPQSKVEEMVHTIYHRGLWFWLSKKQQAFGPASQKLLEYVIDKLTKFYFHINRGSHIISNAWLKEPCEAIYQLVYSEMTGVKPIKLVFFI
jgi:hypothetical protein